MTGLPLFQPLRLLMFVAAFVALAVPSADAGEMPRPVVVELFTSQGCSSCPPADRLLTELADEEDVLALSFFVDYWDYLGWKDTLASPAFTQRQRDYAHALGLRGVYTPQIVVDGLSDVVGSRASQVEAAIATRRSEDLTIPLDIDWQGDMVDISLPEGEKPDRKNVTVWLVRFAKRQTVEIARGENSGNTFTYTNVVRDLAPIGVWRGDAMTVSLDRKTVLQGDMDCSAILLQVEGSGAIVGAARLAMAAAE